MSPAGPATPSGSATPASVVSPASPSGSTTPATPASVAGPGGPAGPASPTTAAVPARRLGPVTPERLRWVSLTHSCIYAALLVCAFALSKPEPWTFALGLGHGLLWIGMSLTCVVCARWRIVSLKLAVAVAVLGGIGPFFGTYELMREGRERPR